MHTTRTQLDPLRPLTLALALALALGSACSLLGRRGPAEAEVAAESQRLARFLDEAFQAQLDRSPQRLGTLGYEQRQDQWDDLSDRHAQETCEMIERDLARLRAEFDLEKLSPDGLLSYRVFEYRSKLHLAGHRWRFHDYPVNQMHGLQAEVPAYLINTHRIRDFDDAWNYIARLNGIKKLFEQLIAGLEERERRGILPPAFVFELVLADCRNVLRGEPFEQSEIESTLLADFRGKLEPLVTAQHVNGDELDAIEESLGPKLMREARNALLSSVEPAYLSLIATLERQATLAGLDDGAWKLPEGEAFYAFAIERSTTLPLDADGVHERGLQEVDRIHDEMREILAQVGFEGSLSQFFLHLRRSEEYYFPSTAGGRAAYLAEARARIAAMDERLPELFDTLPSAPLEVRPVEAYRERSAGKAFYSRGTPDGSRPGVYYVNLYELRDMPRYQLEALAYHEAIPGHHMQISIAQELKDVPRFRRFGGFTAYSEGWGLYSEYLPKELGFYGDPYADFGRLAMELWRACRLVVDTGLHARKWTRQEAIDYLMTHTPNPLGDCTKAIERYIVMPGQATAYMIGMLRILELRAEAKAALGADFDLRAFHDVVLTSGPVPLSLLSERVRAWAGAPKQE